MTFLRWALFTTLFLCELRKLFAGENFVNGEQQKSPVLSFTSSSRYPPGSIQPRKPPLTAAQSETGIAHSSGGGHFMNGKQPTPISIVSSSLPHKPLSTSKNNDHVSTENIYKKQQFRQMETKSTVPSNFLYRFNTSAALFSLADQLQSIEHYEVRAKSLPICTSNQHINGIWATSTEESLWQNKSYVCCGSKTQDNIKPSTRVDCGSHRHVKYDEISHIRFGVNDYPLMLVDNSCMCDVKSGGKTKVSQRERYKWFPSECRLLDWDAKQFCSLLGDQTLMLHGDSTQGQLFGSLVAQIYAGQGGCAHQIQRLPYSMELEHPLSELLIYLRSISASTIIVLNQGPHFKSTEEVLLYTHFLNNELANAIHTDPFIAAVAGNISLVWRTTSPGHYNCDDIVAPTSPSDPKLQLAEGADHYRYSLFPYWDDLLIAAAKKLNIPVMDMSPLYFRADAHPGSFENGGYDCLHNCLPGPVDIGAHILLQMLYNDEIKPLNYHL